ncbi:MAG: hypothetical protein OEN50_11665 [Deltaproteobacteria bacterium]|nr:hypothetical protein [Deltaproteobacteria bacterium]
MIKKLLCVVKLALGLTFLVGPPPSALGEQLFIVGLPPGGGYDTYTRTVARHIGKYIPGNPTPVVQNMVGGGSLDAAHYIYDSAVPDGLTVGVWNSGLVLRQALGDRAVKFKADRFGWIGAPTKGYVTCAVMGFTGLKTLEDVLNSNKPIKMGGSRPGLVTHDLPRILNVTLGTKFDPIPGYEGTARIRIALQTREVEGVCFGWEAMRVTARAMLDAKGDNKLIPFVTHGDFDDPEVKHLPRLTEVIRGKENQAILDAYLLSYDFQRPFMVPPKTPKEQLGILRKAFKATLEDREFLANAKKAELFVNYVSGEAIEMIIDQILAIAPNTKAKLQFLISEKEK